MMRALRPYLLVSGLAMIAVSIPAGETAVLLASGWMAMAWIAVRLTSLLGLHCKMRAVALCAKMNVALGIESEIVAAGNVVQPSFLHLEILRCGAQRSHHWSDVEICHEVLPSKICKGSGHSSRFKCLERRQVAVTWRGTNIARDAAFLCSRANAGASAT